ncbi:MAG: hypothetical protein ACE5GZ_10210 [Gammaproteobacteria bacterium]
MKTIVMEHRVDWIHCDPAGIMFYPEYYIWFDQATERSSQRDFLLPHQINYLKQLILMGHATALDLAPLCPVGALVWRGK